jgi:hypothetical protein
LVFSFPGYILVDIRSFRHYTHHLHLCCRLPRSTTAIVLIDLIRRGYQDIGLLAIFKLARMKPLIIGLICSQAGAFSHLANQRRATIFGSPVQSAMKSSFDGNRFEDKDIQAFEPLIFVSDEYSTTKPNEGKLALRTALTLIPLMLTPSNALSVTFSYGTEAMNPRNFNPVCPASDNFYRFLQGTTEAVVGRDSFVEYGPLIAGGLLRIRLELCVVESFFNEAVGPFIQQNGVSWVLPLHETVETFLAGTIFSLASTFILVGSTKILAVIVTYADVFLGAPARLLGSFAFDRARGKPVTLDIGFGPFKRRLIGPPEEKNKDGISADERAMIDFANTSPVNLAVIVLSGGVKLYGETSRVSAVS